MSYQVFALKWRPKKFTDVVGHEVVVKSLQHALAKDSLHHAYLLTGTRGVGKTSIARLMAKSMSCEQGISANPCNVCLACTSISEGNFVDVMEIDAASRTKVEDMRDLLDNVQYMPAYSRMKIYIIDEVHMLSGHSFNALLKTLEEPPKHVKFILATTNPEKLPITILSRCLRIHLKNLSNEVIEEHLINILELEKIEFTKEAVKSIADAASGSARDALSILEQAIAYGQGKLTNNDVLKMLGRIDENILYDLIESVHYSDKPKIGKLLREIKDTDYKQLLDNMLDILYKVAMLISVPDTVVDKNERLERLSEIVPATTIQLFYQFVIAGLKELPYSHGKQTFNMTILRMLDFLPVKLGVENSYNEVKEVSEVKNVKPETVSLIKEVKPNVSDEKVEPIKPVEKKSQVELKPQGLIESKANFTELKINDWTSLINTIRFTGLVKALLGNCVVEKFENRILILKLNEQFKAMLSIPYKEEVEKLFSEHFNVKIIVDIKTGEHNVETPIQQNERELDERTKKAKEDMQNDKNIKNLIETYEAKIKEISVI